MKACLGDTIIKTARHTQPDVQAIGATVPQPDTKTEFRYDLVVCIASVATFF